MAGKRPKSSKYLFPRRPVVYVPHEVTRVPQSKKDAPDEHGFESEAGCTLRNKGFGILNVFSCSKLFVVHSE